MIREVQIDGFAPWPVYLIGVNDIDGFSVLAPCRNVNVKTIPMLYEIGCPYRADGMG